MIRCMKKRLKKKLLKHQFSAIMLKDPNHIIPDNLGLDKLLELWLLTQYHSKIHLCRVKASRDRTLKTDQFPRLWRLQWEALLLHPKQNYSNWLTRKQVKGLEHQDNLNEGAINSNFKYRLYHPKTKTAAVIRKDKDKEEVWLAKTNHHRKLGTETQEEHRELICSNKYLQRHQTLSQTMLNRLLVYKKKVARLDFRDRLQV